MPSVDVKSVEREVRINASAETVFSYLTDASKLRRWMSMGGTWDPAAGEAFRLQLTKEDVAMGKFLEIDPPKRLVFSWGWESEDAVTKPGSTTVEITLAAQGTATLVRLVHRDLPTVESAQAHSRGWEHYLQRLALAASGADPGHDSYQD